MPKKIGTHTMRLCSPPSIIAFASTGSKKESEGPLAQYFDHIEDDSTFKQQSWEKAESKMIGDTVTLALSKAGLAADKIDAILSGDLLNQCVSSSFGLRDTSIPHIGVFSACATMAQALGLGAVLLDGGGFEHVVAATSSHFCTAERQFRFPLEYGGQRPLTSQWTVTGAGAAVVGRQQLQGPFIRHVTFGCIEDKGIKDANNMGAAMAPSAATTLTTFFKDTSTRPSDYDLILTGDLGYVGSELLKELMLRNGYELGDNYTDCGLLIYDRETQDVHSGGSGCGCCASVLCSYILPAVREGRLKNVLVTATGALLSTTSIQQGEPILGVSHLVHITHGVSDADV